MSIPDETLMAFADGTLPPAEAERVAAAVEADPALAERVGQLAAGRAIAARAFRDVLEEPVPADLLAAAGAPPAPPAAGNDNRRGGWRRIVAGVAAGLAAGVVLGALLPRPGGGPARPGLLPSQVAAALDGADGAGVALGAAHLAEGGFYCRQFTLQEAAGATLGLACREDDGWRLRIAVARSGGGFQPASGEDPLIAEVLERLGAGPALDPAAEEAARRGGWRAVR